jgi:hypothetical protein
MEARGFDSRHVHQFQLQYIMINSDENSPPQTEGAIRLKAENDAGITADKQLRKDLDAQLQKLKSLPASRERAHSITKIQEAIMWLGMDLKRLSDTNPYPNSYRPENTIVDKTADGLQL